MINCSVITIVYNRNEHLQNLVYGLLKGQQMPSELIVVDIGQTVEGIDYGGLNVKIVQQPKPSTHLPLAAARNLGAQEAQTDQLLFLDVDCIPHENFVSQLIAYLKQHPKALLMGTPRYLKKKVALPIDFQELEKDSIFHPYRPKSTLPVERCQQYELFWSLCFGITAATFQLMGGFDEQYIGYGGEDTDFAFKARERGVPFFLVNVWAYHQQHAVYRPPINRLDDIVVNSHIFHEKWGRWPMEGWLQEFVELNLIDWNNNQPNIKKLKNPSKQLMEACHFPDAPFV